MGIDVYLSWDGMTDAERKARYTGFDIYSGHLGYLREAYHGGEYATMVLISENWDKQPKKGFKIKNSVLESRLKKTVEAAILREKEVYGGSDEDGRKSAKAFEDFVALHGEKERAGLNPRITISY